MKVVIDFAGNRLEFSFRSNIRGQVTWLETKDAKDIELPKDLAQMPDVGVYLVRDGIGQSKKVHSGWAGTNNKKNLDSSTLFRCSNLPPFPICTGPLQCCAHNFVMSRTPPTFQIVTTSWARIPAAKLIAESFAGTPSWVTLQADQSRDRYGEKLGSTNYPGALLLRLGSFARERTERRAKKIGIATKRTAPLPCKAWVDRYLVWSLTHTA